MSKSPRDPGPQPTAAARRARPARPPQFAAEPARAEAAGSGRGDDRRRRRGAAAGGLVAADHAALDQRPTACDPARVAQLEQRLGALEGVRGELGTLGGRLQALCRRWKAACRRWRPSRPPAMPDLRPLEGQVAALAERAAVAERSAAQATDRVGGELSAGCRASRPSRPSTPPRSRRATPSMRWARGWRRGRPLSRSTPSGAACRKWRRPMSSASGGAAGDDAEAGRAGQAEEREKAALAAAQKLQALDAALGQRIAALETAQKQMADAREPHRAARRDRPAARRAAGRPAAGRGPGAGRPAAAGARPLRPVGAADRGLAAAVLRGCGEGRARGVATPRCSRMAARPAWWTARCRRLGGLVTIRRGEQVVWGDAAEAEIERARRALEAGDLEMSLTHIDKLPPPAGPRCRPGPTRRGR